MKNRTKANELYLLPAIMMVFGLVFSPFGLERANAQNSFNHSKGLACDAGFSGIWMIDKVCDLGGDMDLKAQDAIHIQCDNQTGQWFVDFYEEPAGADPNSPVSQATQYSVCPGNGRLVKTQDGKLVLQCNYWESVDNISKQLEFALQPMVQPGLESMTWLSRELQNPNVVCGVAGRGDSGGADGTSGRTID